MRKNDLGKTRFVAADYASHDNDKPFELYIVTLSPINLQELLRRQRRAVRVRLVDAAGRREAGSSRI